MKKWPLKRLSIFRTLPQAMLIGASLLLVWTLIEHVWPGGDCCSQEYSDGRPYDRVAEGAFLLLVSFGMGCIGISRIYRNNRERRQYCEIGQKRWVVATAAVLIIGWGCGVYGTILLLPALRDLAFLDRRPEDVRVQTVVIAELELGDIERQILFADLVEGPDHAALDERDKGQNSGEPSEHLRIVRDNLSRNILGAFVLGCCCAAGVGAAVMLIFWRKQ